MKPRRLVNINHVTARPDDNLRYFLTSYKQ